MTSPRALCDEILAADKTATPGPWEADDLGGRIEVCEVIVGTVIAEIDASHDVTVDRDLIEADARFIALSRTAAPEAAEHALKLAEELESLAGDVYLYGVGNMSMEVLRSSQAQALAALAAFDAATETRKP